MPVPGAWGRLSLGTESPWHSLWGFVHRPWTSTGRATCAGGGRGPGSSQSLSSLPSLLHVALLSSRGPSLYLTLLILPSPLGFKPPLLQGPAPSLLLIYSFIYPHHSIPIERQLHSRPLLDTWDPLITRYTVPALFGIHSLGEIEGRRLVTSIPKICFHLVINGEKQISCLPQEAPPTETFPLGNHLLGCELWREELHSGPVPYSPQGLAYRHTVGAQ